jgi:hypothetical protein
MGWIDLALGRENLRPLVNTVMNFVFPEALPVSQKCLFNGVLLFGWLDGRSVD